MKELQASFQLVASLAVLLLLTAVTLVLGGVFNELQPAQAAFLGALFAAAISFLGLLTGALYNSRLNRAAVEADERKREQACLSNLFYRVRALTTTFGMMSRTVDLAAQISTDMIRALEDAIESVQPAQFPDLRLVRREVRHEYHDLDANLMAMRFMTIGPIKRCAESGNIYEVHDDAIRDLQFALQTFFAQAVVFRKLIARAADVPDIGPSSLEDIQLQKLFSIDRRRDAE